MICSRVYRCLTRSNLKLDQADRDTIVGRLGMICSLEYVYDIRDSYGLNFLLVPYGRRRVTRDFPQQNLPGQITETIPKQDQASEKTDFIQSVTCGR